jgi:hypothetical protein
VEQDALVRAGEVIPNVAMGDKALHATLWVTEEHPLEPPALGSRGYQLAFKLRCVPLEWRRVRAEEQFTNHPSVEQGPTHRPRLKSACLEMADCGFIESFLPSAEGFDPSPSEPRQINQLERLLAKPGE